MEATMPDRHIAKQKIIFSTAHWNDLWNTPIDEAIAELEREALVRQKCYDRWVSEARLSYTEARDRLKRHLTAIRLLRLYETSLEDRAAKEELSEIEGADEIA